MVFARPILVPKSESACDHGISTDSCEEVDKLASDKAALCGGLHELGAENKIEQVVHC